MKKGKCIFDVFNFYDLILFKCKLVVLIRVPYFRVPKSTTCRKIDFEDEEERRIKEGAETLLNLAGITTRKRYNSQSREDDSNKCMRLAETYEKPTHFRPRLLRKKKDTKKLSNNNNNNNNNTDDAWVKHRRELEINQGR